MAELILASASPRRRELIRSFGIPFELLPVDADENIAGSIEERVVALAKRKADRAGDIIENPSLATCGEKKYLSSVTIRDDKVCILGVDTLVGLDGQVLGKPANMEEAREMIRLLQDNWHEVLSGVCVKELSTGETLLHCETTRVHFLPMTEKNIDDYFSLDNPLDKAGAYGIQSGAGLYIDRIEGCYYNVVGFPLSAVRRMLGNWFAI